jgi:hypothetical protein
MATFSRNAYPKAMPLHSPDELNAQASKLSQLQEEVSAQARRAAQRDKELAEKAARLRRWTGRLVGAIVLAVMLTAGVTTYSLNRVGLAPASPAKEPASPVANFTPPLESAPPVAPKLAPLTLPANAQAKPSDGAANAKTDFLEALGSLSATHLYQSHLNIGLLADGVESGTYTIADAEESLKPVIDMMKLVDVRLAKLAKSELDAEDRRSIQQIQTVSALLRLQTDALRAYWATGEMQQATDFQEARRASWQGVSKVMGLDR